MPPVAGPEKPPVPPRGPTDSQIRRRTGNVAIPPWEKQP